MDENLSLRSFLMRLPPVNFVAVAGECGKSTVEALIKEIFSLSLMSKENAFSAIDLNRPDLFGDYLKKIKRDGVVLAKIPKNLIEEFSQAGVNPTIVIFVCVDAKNFDIYHLLIKNHTYTNYIIGTDETIDSIKKRVDYPIKSKILRTGTYILPKNIKLSGEPYHLRENASLSVRVAEIFNIPKDIVSSALERFKWLSGRLELIRDFKGVSYINDAYSEHFISLRAAISSLSKNKNIVLIFGGNSSDDVISPSDISSLSQYCHTFIILPGTGSQLVYRNLLDNENLSVIYAEDINKATKIAIENSREGDVIIFSPGFCPNKICGPDRESRSSIFRNVVKSL